MKILVISSHEQQYGGGEGRVAFEFAVEMSKRHDVVLMYPGVVPERLPEGARLEVYPIRSIDYTVPALTGGEIGAIFRFLDSFRPDVIHSHTPWVLGAIIQAWAFVKGVPFYFTAHELPSKILEWGLVRYMKGMSRTGLLHVLTRTYLVTFCRHCTAVVALNQPAAGDIRSIGFRGKIHIIPNGRTLADYNGSVPTDLHQEEKILTFTVTSTLARTRSTWWRCSPPAAEEAEKNLLEALKLVVECYREMAENDSSRQRRCASLFHLAEA